MTRLLQISRYARAVRFFRERPAARELWRMSCGYRALRRFGGFGAHLRRVSECRGRRGRIRLQSGRGRPGGRRRTRGRGGRVGSRRRFGLRRARVRRRANVARGRVFRFGIWRRRRTLRRNGGVCRRGGLGKCRCRRARIGRRHCRDCRIRSNVEPRTQLRECFACPIRERMRGITDKCGRRQREGRGYSKHGDARDLAPPRCLSGNKTE